MSRWLREKRALTLAVLVVAAAAAPAGRQTAKPAPPPRPIAADRVARLDRWLRSYIDDGRVAGAVALVLQDGQVAYERAVGWADREAGRRMTPDAMFRIASQTKAITATAALILVEEGRLQLSDRVSRYIPSFAKTMVLPATGEAVPAKRPITIRDLMTFTAGVSYGTNRRVAAAYQAVGLGPAAGQGWYFADKNEPICDTMTTLGGLPFVAQPGEAWVYGYSSDILGCVIERASGQPLDEFIRTRVTGPLRMTDSYFYVPPEKRDRLTAVYAAGPDGKAVRADDGPLGQGKYVDGPRRSFSGGGGMVSTARDYGRFLEMVRRGGALDGARILSPRAVALMTTNLVGTLHSSTGMGWSLAFETVEQPGASGLSPAGTYGWGSAYGAIYWVDPADRLTMILEMQLIPNATDIREKFATMVLQAFGQSRDPEERPRIQFGPRATFGTTVSRDSGAGR